MTHLYQTVQRRKYEPRTCHNCGRPYSRRNLFEAWIAQNPGHRTGWRKVEVKLCVRCQDQQRSVQSLIVVEAKISNGNGKVIPIRKQA